LLASGAEDGAKRWETLVVEPVVKVVLGLLAEVAGYTFPIADDLQNMEESLGTL
jgi:hypothetical protein